MARSEQMSGENPNVLLGAAWVGGTVAGWLLSGGFLAVLLGLAAPGLVALVLGVRRARQVGAALDAPSPDVSALPARQALAALSAAAQGAASFDSPQLQAVDKIEADSGGRPDRALALAEALRSEYPRSPVVVAECARRHAAVGDTEQAQNDAAQSIALALHGGMNPMAAKLLAEFKAYRAGFELRDADRRRLAGAAEANGDESGAAWCRQGLDSP